MGTSWRTAPADAVCCYRCKRYLPPEKLDGTRCADEKSCRKAAAKNNRAVWRSDAAMNCEPPKRKRRA